VLFCIHETRQKDYAAYAEAEPGVNDMWKSIMPVPPDHPVMWMNWHDAQAFCAWLSRKEGKAYRMPTDHEWSLAVGLQEAAPLTHDTLATEPLNTRLYPWGTHFPPTAQDANFAGKPKANMTNSTSTMRLNVQFADIPDPYVRTAPVMSFRPNPFGLYDMGGNAEEWCAFGAAPGRQTPILRGSNYGFWPDPRQLRSSNRQPGGADVRQGWYGFRVVLDPDRAPQQ